jgi:DNA invertase Pin-like site-specific DNA recombinase
MESQINSIDQNYEIKKVRYNRISTANGNQKLDRQRVNLEKYSLILEDTVSGLVPFFDRPSGSTVKALIDSGQKFDLVVIGIDRIGRSLADCAYLIQFLTDNGIGLICEEQNLRTLNEDRTPNPMALVFVNLMLVFSSMEKAIQKQRIEQGVAVRKAKGLYKGRVPNSCESDSRFLCKPKIERFLRLYKQGGITIKRACEICEISQGTATKALRRAKLKA